jgi:hypothetical protein
MAKESRSKNRARAADVLLHFFAALLAEHSLAHFVYYHDKHVLAECPTFLTTRVYRLISHVALLN